MLDFMIYLSGALVSYRHPQLGFILTPDMGQLPPERALVAADNGCFANPKDYTDARYLKFLANFCPSNTLFATAPDVYGDHKLTVKRSVPMLRAIRKLGLSPAFVAQDEWQEASTPWDDFDVLFIGGTNTFKLYGGYGAARSAKHRNKKVHMGRVNSLKRMVIAKRINCDSVDGTFLKFGPDKNIKRLFTWFEYLDREDVYACACPTFWRVG